MEQQANFKVSCIKSRVDLLQRIGELVKLDNHKVVEIFRTNVTDQNSADHVVGKILETWPDLKVNFDLEDCDNILRVESPHDILQINGIMDLVKEMNYRIERLK